MSLATLDEHDDRTRIIALSLTYKIGWVLIHRLLERFGTLECALAASIDELRSVHGIGAQIAANIRAIDLANVAADLARMESQGIQIATWQDATYPAQLTELDDRPLTIFWKGTLPLDAPRISIVGTREAQPASLALAKVWAAAFAAKGWSVISGMARGIDTAAHQGALETGGQTVAVLGCGVNVIYPPENRALAQEIIQHGALLSEFHPGTAPSPTGFARRNRLIAALGQALIVVEAGKTSGALYAARHAYDLGRPVFAVDNSAGNAILLAEKMALPLPENPDELLIKIASL